MKPGFDGKLIPWQGEADLGAGKFMREMSLTDSRVYHMLPWCYARMILERGKLRLSRVDSWTDPYEKWWCEALAKRLQNMSGLQAYGLCWTTGAYDEPRWRMAAFRRTDPIVRIRTPMAALLEAGRSFVKNQLGALYLGRVRYRHEDKLRALAKTVTGGELKEVARTVAEVLLQKRIAFKFEQEVRLLWLARGAPKESTLIDVDVRAVIDQVRVSPYATDGETDEIQRCVDGFGITFKKSSLLQVTFPPLPL